MYEGFLEFGDTEIINDARTAGYVATADCSIGWLKCPPCDGLADALDAPRDYDVVNISDAPWYDVRNEATSRFYGVHGLLFENLPGSTRTAEAQEGILDGGVVGRVRNATRRVRVEVMLSAQGEDALEAGLAWLDAALRPGRCHEHHDHGSGCGPHADVRIFTACPPPAAGDPADHLERLESLTRYMHTVTVVAGPTVIQKHHRGDAWGYHVEFVMISAVPWLHGLTKKILTMPATPIVIQDVPFNLVPYPSAELGSGTVVVAENLSPNPSVEVNATGWDGWSGVITGANPAAFITHGRTTELAAGGSAASARTRLLGNNGSTVVTNAIGFIAMTHIVPLGTRPAGTRVSFSIWGAATVSAGGAGSGIEEMVAVVEWRNASDVQVQTNEFGATTTPADFGGKVYTLKGQPIPAGAVSVHFYVRARVRWSSSATPANNSDIRLYADTVAVTIP